MSQVRPPSSLAPNRLRQLQLAAGASLLVALHPGMSLAKQLAPAAPASSAAADPAGTKDPLFQQPFIDVDEWRDAPVRHRYIHGGFKGTETRFSFYFPAPERYQGRFFQYIAPIPDSEFFAQTLAPGVGDKIGLAIDSGAYFIETNGGGKFELGRPNGADPTISAYRANAAAAEYSRVVAARIYGRQHRPYGYAYGGSGGAYRTIGSLENTNGVWDGVVPYVMGSTMALPNVFTVRMHAMRILHDKLPQIIDAMEPGGGGDPYAGLNAEQKAALTEVTKMGFPLKSWFGYKTMGIHGFIALYGGVVASDPGYFTKFWNTPGYYGADHPESFAKARVHYATTISAPLARPEAEKLGLVTPERNGGVDNAFKADAPPLAFRLAGTPPAVDFLGGDLIVKTGAAAGKKVMLVGLKGDVVVLGVADPTVVTQIKPGDQVEVDNSNFLAVQTYHRHQVPGPEFHVWDQFRGPDGKPLYPQRPFLLGPRFVQATAGSLETGKFNGKMIVVESLIDREAFPWQADWYRDRVKEHLGDKTDDNFRLYFTDNALHGDGANTEDDSRTVTYVPVLEQALRDLSLWVERGVKPADNTAYKIVDGQVVVPATATERKGLQPTVKLTVNGGVKTTVKPGALVKFSAAAQVAPGGGKVIALEWDPEGKGAFVPLKLPSGPKPRLSAGVSHAYAKPGVYFAGVRVISQRDGDTKTPYARIQNLDRVRVIVR